MTDKEVIFEAMKAHNYNANVLAKSLGYSHTSGVTERLRVKQAMRCDTFVKFLDEMGFEVIVKSKLADKTEFTVSFPKEA